MELRAQAAIVREAELSADVHPYASLAYARTLAHVGQPMHVPAWGTHVIIRSCNDRGQDASGVYPVACLSPESDIRSGIDCLRQAGLVAAILVVDGLSGPPASVLQRDFPFARPFKTHYLVDRRFGPYKPTEHHRYEVRRALKRGVQVAPVQLCDILDAWSELYDELIEIRRITGVQKFSRASFEALVNCDGLHVVAAYLGGKIAACHLWFQHKEILWSHLAATSALGYKNGASFAIYDYSISNFAGTIVDLGGSPGLGDAASDGLARFKAGFSNRTQRTHLYGAVLDPDLYKVLCARQGTSDSDYFPAYRAPSAVTA